MIECGYEHFKETWWVPIVKEGLEVPALVYELKDRLPWLAIMEKDDKGNLVDVSKLLVCSPVPPHDRLPVSTRVRPGDAVILKRVKTPCSMDTNFVSKGSPGPKEPRPLPLTKPTPTPTLTPTPIAHSHSVLFGGGSTDAVCNMYVDWTTIRDACTGTWTTWFAFALDANDADKELEETLETWEETKSGGKRRTTWKILYHRLSDANGAVVERYAVLQAQVLFRALHRDDTTMLRIHIPSTLAVAMSVLNDWRRLQVHYWRASNTPLDMPDVYVPVEYTHPVHAKNLRRYLVAFVKRHAIKNQVEP